VSSSPEPRDANAAGPASNTIAPPFKFLMSVVGSDYPSLIKESSWTGAFNQRESALIVSVPPNGGDEIGP
jgi:hypothetical protein